MKVGFLRRNYLYGDAPFIGFSLKAGNLPHAH